MTDQVGYWHQRDSLSLDVPDHESLDEWAGDRERFLTFHVNVDDPTVHDALEDVRAVLDEHDCTTVAPPEYYHITVKQVGFPSDSPDRESDITSEMARDIRQRAREAIADVEPFEVELPRLNLFPRVVFCEVQEADPLRRLHAALCDLPGMPAWEYEREEYTPHITLGHFRSAEGFDELVTELEQVRERDRSPLRIDTLKLVDVPPAGLYPEFRTVEAFEL